MAMFLGLLAVVAALLMQMSVLGRAAARFSTDEASAELLARSGIEYAVARLSRDWDRPRIRTPRNAAEDWACRDAPGTPIERVRNPSYNLCIPGGGSDRYVETSFPGDVGYGRYDPADGFAGADDRDGNGTYTGWSGRIARGVGSHRSTFVLQVEDESGKLNVNGGVPGAGRVVGWNGQLVRVLNALGSQPEIGYAPVAGAGLGDWIFNHRPGDGYTDAGLRLTVEQAYRSRGALPRDLSPYLTIRSWIDAKVVRPNARAAEATAGTFVAISDIKAARSPLTLESGGRPPVHLNSAPRPVVAALLTGLSGISCSNPYNTASYTLTPAHAAAIADQIVAFRDGRDPGGWYASVGLSPGPFRSWPEFSAFCDALLPWTITGLEGSLLQQWYGGGNQCGADLLKANFDPNTALNKHVPDQIEWRWIDKSDLLAWSTEGSLHPTGAFRISSLGRLRDRVGAVLAEARVSALVDMFGMVRETTQADFVRGRRLSDAPRYLSPSTRTVERSAGAALGWGGAPGTGLAAMTYPCAMPAVEAGRAANFDGSILLATTERFPTAYGGVPYAFLHRFDDAWTADTGGSPACIAGPGGALRQDDVAQSVWPSPPALQGTFLPDGAFLDWFRAPAYAGSGNLPARGHRGVVSFWAKTGGGGGAGGAGMDYACAMTAFRGDHPATLTQAMLVGFQNTGPNSGRWMMLLEMRKDPNDPDVECGATGSYAANLPGCRWRLVTAFWDIDNGVVSRDLSLHSHGYPSSSQIRNYATSFLAGAREDPVDVSNPIVLGVHPELNDYQATHANQVVIDEFAVCDYAADPAAAQDAAANWAGETYSDGRYYKGNDAKFLSASVDPSPGRTDALRRIYWTAYLPREDRKERGSGGISGWFNRVLDPTLTNARVSVRLLDQDGLPRVPPEPPVVQGVLMRRVLPGPFRYEVTFEPTWSWTDPVRDSSPVLESPVFDDITFCWQPPEGFRWFGWEEG